MSYRLTSLMLALALAVSACGKSDTAPSAAAAPKFTATLLPSNEVPAITNADASGSGSVTVTVNATKDSAGNITAATADFTVNLSGFPANTTLTGGHIHQAAVGVNGGIVWNTTLTNGEVVLANGSGSFTKTSTNPTDVAIAQALINNPAGFYFNIHTTLNTGGAVRGQLTRAN